MSKCHFAVFNTVITIPEFWGKLIQKYMFLLSSGKGRQGMPGAYTEFGCNESESTHGNCL